MPPTFSVRTIGRLSLYRRLLNNMVVGGVKYLFSHDLANMAGVTAAQVRRDVMAVGYNGSPTRGYDVAELAASIGAFLDAGDTQGVALVGVGNLGRAVLTFFAGRRPNLAIVAAFDRDPAKTGRVLHGCRCFLAEDMPRVVKELKIAIAILAVPAAEAQAVADQLVAAGVRGLLNFAPTPLRVPPNVYVEDMDMTAGLEKVAFFARQ
jgi:redox-sensing transcriptional repressor